MTNQVNYLFLMIINRHFPFFYFSKEILINLIKLINLYLAPWSKGMYERTVALKNINKDLKVMLAVGGEFLNSSFRVARLLLF